MQNLIQFLADNRPLLIGALVALMLIGLLTTLRRGSRSTSGHHGGHDHHVHLCRFIPGKGLWWLISRRIGVPLLCAAALLSTGVHWHSVTLTLWSLAPCLLVVLYLAFILRDVSENTYAVPSRVNRILPYTRGEGLHEAVPGDEYFQIPINPIVVNVSVSRQVLDHRVAYLDLQVTLLPEPRIANARGVNAFGAWTIEGTRHGHEDEAVHHVDAAIKKALAGLLGQLISRLTSDEINEMQYAIALLVESEISLFVPLHRDNKLRCEIQGSQDEEPKLGDVVRWYHKHQRSVRNKLDELAREFSDDPEEEIDPRSLSHHEAHVGSVFERVEIVDLKYDEATTLARAGVDVATHQAKAVTPLLATVTAAVTELVDKKVSPDAALAAAMTMAKQGAFAGNVFAGGGDLAKAGALGTVLGAALGEKKKE